MEAEVHLVEVWELLDRPKPGVGPEEALQEGDARDACTQFSPAQLMLPQQDENSRIGRDGQRQAPYHRVVQRRALVLGRRALDGHRVVNEIRGRHCDGGEGDEGGRMSDEQLR